MRARLGNLGQEIFPREQQNAGGVGCAAESEIEKWWPIIKAAGIKGE
jgi:hypothetical protein